MRHYLGLLPRSLWKVFFVLNFVIGLVLLFPLYSILLSRKKWFRSAFRLMRFHAKWTLYVPGIFLDVQREIPAEKLPERCVYIANHTSYLDIVISYIVIPKYFIYMGKLEIDKAPLLRIFFKEMNLLVDRKSRSASYKAFQLAAERLQHHESIFIYPEGTIEARGRLKLFKNGAFRLAIENQVPVVPVTFINNWKLLQNGGFFKAYGRPGIAKVVVHKPIPTKGMTEKDLITLRHNVREIIAQTLHEHESRQQNRTGHRPSRTT